MRTAGEGATPDAAIDATTAAPIAHLEVLDWGLLRYADALRRQKELVAERIAGSSPDRLVLVEHPPVVTIGRSGSPDDMRTPERVLRGKGVEVHRVDRGGMATFHGPGQLVAYPIIRLRDHDLHAHLGRLLATAGAVLQAFGLEPERREGRPGIWVGGRKIASVGIAVRRWVTYHGVALNVSIDPAGFGWIVPCGHPDEMVTSMASELGRPVAFGEVKVRFVAEFAASFGYSTHFDFVQSGVSASGLAESVCAGKPASLPKAPDDGTRDGRIGNARHQQGVLRPNRGDRMERPSCATRTCPGTTAHDGNRKEVIARNIVEPYRSNRHPEWLVHPAPSAPAIDRMERMLGRLRLATVCQSAHCPNLGECFERGTATFMILGDRCTRNCGFCAVEGGNPERPDPGEPERVARAARALGLGHVVVTSVTRDDLPDGGARQFEETIRQIRRTCPSVRVEVLVPDFNGSVAALQSVCGARPDVFNHNLETVPRLYARVRPGAQYRRSLAILEYAARQGLAVKSGLMLGLGETPAEMRDTLSDLRRTGCPRVTLGQYLAPSGNHVPVDRYVPPEEFTSWAEEARSMGFKAVAAGPLVRSSYRAEEMLRNKDEG